MRKKKIDLSQKTPEEQKEYYKNRMLQYLSRRRTSWEIQEYLEKLGCSKEMAEELTSFAENYGFADDEEYVRCYIRDASSLKHRSRRRIRYDLLQKGVGREIIDQLMEEEAPSEEETIRWLVTHRLSDPSDPEACRHMGAYLQTHGFSYELIQHVMKELNE